MHVTLVLIASASSEGSDEPAQSHRHTVRATCRALADRIRRFGSTCRIKFRPKARLPSEHNKAGHYRPSSETPLFEWRFSGGLIVATSRLTQCDHEINVDNSGGSRGGSGGSLEFPAPPPLRFLNILDQIISFSCDI